MTLFVILGGLFLLGLVLWIFYGYGFVVKSVIPKGSQPIEKCGLCQKKFPRAELVERQVGDATLLYFCATCVGKLKEEAALKQQRK